MTEWKGDGISMWLLLFSLNMKERVSLALHLRGILSSSSSTRGGCGPGELRALAWDVQMASWLSDGRCEEEQDMPAWLNSLAPLRVISGQAQGPIPRVALSCSLSHVLTVTENKTTSTTVCKKSSVPSEWILPCYPNILSRDALSQL